MDDSSWADYLRRFDPFRPAGNPTFRNPEFDAAPLRVLIVRLSPFRDVDRSLPHLFLFHEVRRARPDAFIDLAFFPAAEERAIFDRESIPYLLGIQSLRPAADFNLVLISNAYLLELVNLPYALLRSGFPLLAGQRGPGWPRILLGGSNALATQAIIHENGDSLVDGIFFGEGEGRVGPIVTGQVDHLPHLWMAGSAQGVVKAVCRPTGALLPVDYPILNSAEARTAKLPIAYGCPAFCTFCFEGYDRKPYRELPLGDLLATARRLKQAQGVEEIDLYSFNFNTHSDIFELILELHRLFDRVSLKSQRVDGLQRTPGLLEAEIGADKREFTLGIEGISGRLRAWLHKSLPTEDVTALLERLAALKARRVKLFYLLSGHEDAADVAEFRQFVRWLKEMLRARRQPMRVIFSFGLLVRMPFTPLRHDRLFLDEQEWRPLIGQVKSACETNGFEFRLAFDWPAYCTAQTLALGGHWLIEPLTALAREGYYFDTTLPAGYWEKLKQWMVETGRWNAAFLGEKGPDYPFPLAFVASNISGDFLYRQYQEACAGLDGGYCLGERDRPARCLGCGACADDAQRRAIVQHDTRLPEAETYVHTLRQVMFQKRRLHIYYFRLRVVPPLMDVRPEFLDAYVFRALLTGHPELLDQLLAVRESLFSVRPNDHQFPLPGGESIFALKAWAPPVLGGGEESDGVIVLGAAENFTPGVFTRLRLDIHLPAGLFAEPRVQLERYLRGAYLPYSLRREGEAYRFELPARAFKKRLLFGGRFETRADGFHATLEIGPKFNPREFLRAFGHERLARCAHIWASDIRW